MTNGPRTVRTRLLRNSNIRVLLPSQLVQGGGWLDAHAYREKRGTTRSVARRPP